MKITSDGKSSIKVPAYVGKALQSIRTWDLPFECDIRPERHEVLFLRSDTKVKILTIDYDTIHNYPLHYLLASIRSELVGTQQKLGLANG